MKPSYFSLGFNPLKASVRMYVPKDESSNKRGYIVWAWWGHYFNPMTYWRWLPHSLREGGL